MPASAIQTCACDALQDHRCAKGSGPDKPCDCACHHHHESGLSDAIDTERELGRDHDYDDDSETLSED